MEATEALAGTPQRPAPTSAQPSPGNPTSELVQSPPAGAPVSEPPAQFATDDKGFVNSNARCERSESVVAIGRTEQSFVVICEDPNGQYEYLGVRLSDEAVLRTAAETTPTQGFLARNASVTYSVSPTELRVTAGSAVIKQEPMIEYRGAFW